MTLTRRLPGIAFRVEPPALADPLPRMDVAAFVGFAACGPCHVPVAVEDVARFEAVFGTAPALAWDPVAGAWQMACLAPAVRDFFAQGGRRCWVVRVADRSAVTNQFPVAGLLQAASGGYAPALVQARSPGSWSDNLLVGASVLVEPLRVADAELTSAARVSLTVSVTREPSLQPGDLLQIDLVAGASRRLAYVALDTVASVEAQPGTTVRQQTVAGSAYWFEPLVSAATLHGIVRQVGVEPPDPGQEATLDVGALRLTPDASGLQPTTGDWLAFVEDGQTDRCWLLVRQVGLNDVQLTGAWREVTPDGGPLSVARVARVMLALSVRESEQLRGVLADLGLSAPHPRFWGYLPDDATLFAPTDGQPTPVSGPPGAALWPEVDRLRFPLAGPVDPAGPFLPLGLEVLPIAWRGAIPQEGLPLQRDGLTPSGKPLDALDEQDWATFVQELFLDPALRYSGEAALLTEAFDRRFIQQQPLTGLHSILPLEEVSLLALPDAAHPGWRLMSHVTQPTPPAPEPPPAPPPCPGHDLFKPKLPAEEPVPPPVPLAPPTIPGQRWEMLPAIERSGLLEVQRCAVEVAAARADLVAILGLPQYDRTDAALDHRRALGLLLRTGRTTASYAALYHPWIVAREASGELRRSGSEGAACGIIAARALARGAWVAPANQVVRHAISLRPELSADDRLALYQEAVNLIWSSPRGFVLMGADTLSEDDPDLVPLGTRRLLILLRRLALREGQTYVFAPHSPAFRRRVALSFERVLALLFTRGAFAGSDPAQSYRVVVDETSNPPASVEQGRFIVELRVAPAQPLTFITVRLIQTGPETLTVQEV